MRILNVDQDVCERDQYECDVARDGSECWWEDQEMSIQKVLCYVSRFFRSAYIINEVFEVSWDFDVYLCRHIKSCDVAELRSTYYAGRRSEQGFYKILKSLKFENWFLRP